MSTQPAGAGPAPGGNADRAVPIVLAILGVIFGGGIALAAANNTSGAGVVFTGALILGGSAFALGRVSVSRGAKPFSAARPPVYAPPVYAPPAYASPAY